jgi:quinoprotein glucose dehydrogenase
MATVALMREGVWRKSPAELAELLNHPDQRVRLAAQFALANRGAESIELLTRVAARKDNALARLHAIWGLGQLARRGQVGADVFLPLLSDGDEEVRCHSAKVLGELRAAQAYGGLVKLLGDPSDRVKSFAAMALGKLGQKEAIPAVLEVLRKNVDADGYLRHACVMALAGINDDEALHAAAKDKSVAVRMGALLAWRRLKSPHVASLLDDPDPAIVVEAARTINDVPIPEAYPQLARLTTPTPPVPGAAPPARPELALVRAANAHYRLGGSEHAAALASLAAGSGAESVRLLALNMLAEWAEPRVRDWICGLPIALPKRDAAPARDALAKVLDDVLRGAPTSVRVAALEAASALNVKTAPLPQIVADPSAPAELRAAALSALARRKDAEALAIAVDAAMSQPQEPLRLAAIRAMPSLKNGLTLLSKVLESGVSREQQTALAAVGTLKGNDPDALLLAAFDRLSSKAIPAEAQLDLLDAAEGRKGKVAEALRRYEASLPKDDPLAPYRVALLGGDAGRGERIFRERADVACLRCHSVRGVGGNAGPDLAGVVRRDPRGREHVLESILFPSRHVAPGFESVIVRTKKGDVYAGVLKSEDAQRLTVDVPNEGLQTIEKSQLDRRKGGMSAMPDDVAKSLSKSDLRDLVEYLSGE